MIIKGEKFFHRAFRPCFIYNSCKSACQEQADIPPVLTCLKTDYSGNRPSYIILSSP